MNRKTWLTALAAVVLCAGSAGGIWFWKFRRPEAERTVVAKIRSAKKFAIETNLQRGHMLDEDMKADVEAVAKSFQIVPSVEPVYAKSKVAVAVSDLGTETGFIMMFYPPDVAFIDSNFYRIKPDFWKALLDAFPKTVEYLKKNHPKALEE